MDTIDTISQLLCSSNSQFRIYDIGRKIEKIPKDIFGKIELNQLPYPSPSQGHACIAIAFWQKKSPQPSIFAGGKKKSNPKHRVGFEPTVSALGVPRLVHLATSAH